MWLTGLSGWLTAPPLCGLIVGAFGVVGLIGFGGNGSVRIWLGSDNGLHGFTSKISASFD